MTGVQTCALPIYRLDPGNCVFVSAKKGTNIDELKQMLYDKAREIHAERFPYNDFLYQKYDQDESLPETAADIN